MFVNKRSLFFLGSSLFSLLYLLFNDVLTWQVYLLPTLFVLLYPFYEVKLSKSRVVSYSISVVLLMYWIRLVLLPMVSYSAINELKTDYSLPIFLTIYEFVVVSIFILIHRNNFEGIREGVRLQGSVPVYIVYSILAIVVYILFARGMGLFDFVVKEVNTIERGGDVTDTKSRVVRQIVSCGMLFGYLVLSVYFARRYVRKRKKKYFYGVLLLSLLFIAIISGERRTSIIYKAFAVSMVLLQLFPTQKRKIIQVIAMAAFVVLAFMTIYKSFHAYMYSSYLEAVNSRSSSEALGGGTFDAYFYGIQTIAKNMEFIGKDVLSFTNLVFDFFRSIFGLHFLLKDGGFTTTQLYNLSIYGGGQTNGYLLAGISYGYAYFGLILAPIVPLITTFFMTKVEALMRKTVSLEMLYIYAIIFMRIAFGFVGDPIPLLNMCSQVIVMYGLFYLVSRLLCLK